jgi:hypothetical protein
MNAIQPEISAIRVAKMGFIGTACLALLTGFFAACAYRGQSGAGANFCAAVALVSGTVGLVLSIGAARWVCRDIRQLQYKAQKSTGTCSSAT